MLFLELRAGFVFGFQYGNIEYLLLWINKGIKSEQAHFRKKTAGISAMIRLYPDLSLKIMLTSCINESVILLGI